MMTRVFIVTPRRMKVTVYTELFTNWENEVVSSSHEQSYAEKEFITG